MSTDLGKNTQLNTYTLDSYMCRTKSTEQLPTPDGTNARGGIADPTENTVTYFTDACMGFH